MSARMRLERFAYTPEGVFGVLDWPGVFSAYTVERPWSDNVANESCIPDGVYSLRPRKYIRGGYDAIEVVNVPDRTLIMIHIANYPTDVEGCIGVGNAFGTLGGRLAVHHSTLAFTTLMDAVKTKGCPTLLSVVPFAGARL